MRKRNSTNSNENTALPLNQCLAKTFGDKEQGRKVTDHCHIVGEVAKELIERMPQWLRDDLFPKGSELIASSHDVGKVSPTFQEKIYRGTQGYINNSKLELKLANPDIEKNWGGHAGVSQATAEHLRLGKYIPKILGQHHGYSPSLSNLANDAIFGGKVWQQQREKLVDELKSRLNTEFPEIKTDTQAKVLSGLTTVADWIGSSSIFDDPAEDWSPLIKKSLDNAGFIKPKLRLDLSFFDVFGFEPREIQQKLIENISTEGVYILEAPMGIGKTEAALYAAYKQLTYGKATGIYFALPTQLTSDKIHERMNGFLESVILSGSPHRESLLVHGNAWLKRIMAVEGNPDGSWFQEGKRGILAPFSVGTIDQALMAVMSVKHGFVRTFGLAGKVVILDEVHSYDAYTGTILDELVKELRKLHCTVIILTATLTTERREKLTAQKSEKQHYPLISVSPNKGGLHELAVNLPKNTSVTIQCCQQQELAIDKALECAENGQQVLWIENTVAEAQVIYQQLSAIDIGVEYGLLHSRFLKCDRVNNEDKWVKLYGKDNPKARKKTGRILVGTQVLEQSLDIDADFLVSRFCPTDMLLQRIGRLWRHKESYRAETAQCEAWLLTPDLQIAKDDAKTAFGKSAKVYSPYVLCRSLCVWNQLKSIELPKDIRTLIEATYKTLDETGTMLQYQQNLEERRKTLQRLALVGLSKGGQTLPEDVSTRYSEQDSVQVLLIKAYQHYSDKQATEITLLNGDKHILPKNLKFYDKSRWRELAALLIQNTVQVADYLAPEKLAIKELEWLKNYFYLGNLEFGGSFLRIAIVNEADEVRRLMGGRALEGYELSYDKNSGYQSS